MKRNLRLDMAVCAVGSSICSMSCPVRAQVKLLGYGGGDPVDRLPDGLSCRRRWDHHGNSQCPGCDLTEIWILN